MKKKLNKLRNNVLINLMVLRHFMRDIIGKPNVTNESYLLIRKKPSFYKHLH
jgi:hypothetical protein